MLLNSVRLICFEICRLRLHFLRNDACRSFSISEFGLYIQKTNSLSVMLLLHICFGLSNSCVVIKGSALLQLALHYPAVSVVHRQPNIILKALIVQGKNKKRLTLSLSVSPNNIAVL